MTVDIAQLIGLHDYLWNPIVFAICVALATALVWMAFAPAPPRREVRNRLDEYLDRGDVVMDEALQQSFFARVVWPALRGGLQILGRLLPGRGLAATRKRLIQAGNPAGLSALDFYGLRVLSLLLFGGLALLLSGRGRSPLNGLLLVVSGLMIGYLLPDYWLRTRVRSRKSAVLRALPDALDMLTIGVEAGLAFESALVRVGERWDNPLTREFRRAVAEMRIGMSREQALARMAERCDVSDLSTFVAVLVQSSRLGVSVAQVLHSQANDIRMRRRQRTEELARQASIRMIIPLAVFVLPALFVVILGPTIPRLAEVLRVVGDTGNLP